MIIQTYDRNHFFVGRYVCLYATYVVWHAPKPPFYPHHHYTLLTWPLCSSLADIAQFQRVLEHPIYQEDPEGIVTEHVHQWVLKDAEGMEV